MPVCSRLNTPNRKTEQRRIEKDEIILRDRFYLSESSPSYLRMKINSQQRSPQRRFAGDVAGFKDNKGYRVVGIGDYYFKVSRIVWILHFGQIPDDRFVDHKDGNPSNNHPSNLQLLTNPANCRAKTKLCRCNTSGYNGVSWRPSNQKWRAYFSRHG